MMAETVRMLDNLQDLEEAFRAHTELFAPPRGVAAAAGQIYCPPCGGVRRVAMRPLYTPPSMGLNLAADSVLGQVVPSLFLLDCLQCRTNFTLVLYQGPDGPTLALLSSTRGGLTTPHTPAPVAYYLDQAHRAQSVGANSAAVSMYRAALEQLLFKENYTKGMLRAKIDRLDADIAAGTAPKWALDLDTGYLDVMKQLGDGAIHANDGDVTKQAEIDNELIAKVKDTFLLLLFVVYEVPHQKTALLGELRKKAGILKK